MTTDILIRNTLAERIEAIVLEPAHYEPTADPRVWDEYCDLMNNLEAIVSRENFLTFCERLEQFASATHPHGLRKLISF